MKIIIILISTVFTGISFAQKTNTDNSITVLNLSNEEQFIWVNAVSYDIASNSNLRVPCNLGENIEVQYIDEIVMLSCGSRKELK